MVKNGVKQLWIRKKTRCMNKMSKYHGKVKNNFIKCGIDPNALLESANRTRRQEPRDQEFLTDHDLARISPRHTLDTELREIDDLYTDTIPIENPIGNPPISTR